MCSDQATYQLGDAAAQGSACARRSEGACFGAALWANNVGQAGHLRHYWGVAAVQQCGPAGTNIVRMFIHKTCKDCSDWG